MNRSPWLTIWLSPRETIRGVAYTSAKGKVFLLANLAALNFCFSMNYNLSAGGIFFSPEYFKLALIISPIIGYLLFLFPASMLYFSGKILKGKATFSQNLNCIAWSYLPGVLGAVFWITFYLWMYISPFNPNLVVDVLLQVVPQIFGLWYLALIILSIKEIQGFTTWKSIACYSLGVVLPLFAMLSVFAFMFVMFFGIKYVLS